MIDADRQTGKTLELVKALPKSGAVVIVHSAGLRRYVERLVEDIHGTETAQAVSVRVVANRCDALEAIQGRAVPVRIDGMWRATAEPGLVKFVDDLASAVEIYCGALEAKKAA